MRTRLPTVLVSLAALAPLAAAQDDDLRDSVTRENGKVVRGRVVEPFAPDEILILQGGKRVRVPREDVAGMELVVDRVAEFLDRRTRAANDPASHWALAGWAAENELPELARVQALTVLTMDPDHGAAHSFLGHREHPRRGWLWKDDERWVTREELEERHDSWGRALEIPSEHFVVRTDAGIAPAIDSLVDLERLYVQLVAEVGPALRLAAATRPMELRLWGDAEDFPKWSGDARPYFVPHPHGDAGHTYRAAGRERPVGLVEVGTQMVLYRCLARDANPGGAQERFCATAELGFAQWMESRALGEAGRLDFGDPLLPVRDAWLALRARDYELPNLLHLSVRDHFYGSFGGAPEVHWASAHAFVAFLMDATAAPDRRDAFLTWFRAALAEGKGDSSSAFDDAFGQEIEKLEEPFESWLAERAG